MLRQIFFLSSTSLTVYHYSGRALHCFGCFVGAEAGLAHFDSYLQRFADLPALVLTDLVEEDFRIDSVAHTLGSDRRALFERHVTRLYRGTSYRHARLLGRDPNNKRKDEVLFSGLLNPEFTDMWLEAMQHHRVPLVGVYSLPLMTRHLVKKVWSKQTDVLFVAHNQASGLRQSFFRNGQVHFSRLTAIPDDLDEADYAHFVHAEIGKTKRYLSNLHLLARDVVLDVCMLSSGERLQSLENMRHNEALTHYYLHDIAEVAQRIGYRSLVNAIYCDELFVYAVATQRVRNHYANDAQRRDYKLYRLRQALFAGSLAVLAAGVLGSGVQIFNGLLLREPTQALRTQLAAAENQYTELEQRTTLSDISPADIQLAVSTANRLREQRHTPLPILSRYGQALLRHPGLEVVHIDWFVSPDRQATAAPSAENDKAQAADSIEYDAEGNPVHADTPTSKYQIGILRGRVVAFDGNFARAHQRIDNLLHDLRAQGNVLSAEALDLPLNIASSGRVVGGVGGESAHSEALFTLRLVIGDAHAQL